MSTTPPNIPPARRRENAIHQVGEVLGGRYEVVGSIGAGGMQEVYKALDQTLDRVVALKVPKNASAERRFKRSALLSAKVNHPNAAKTLDYFEDGGRSYLIEEFIEGQDLHDLRVRLPLMDPYLVAHILHYLAHGVAASHHVDVVHRDLKPSNIMVSPGLSLAVVKITDFGIAKMAEEELKAAAEDDQSLTASQTAVGALPYMSPEMIKTPSKSGKPTDVWALGAICYELLTGTKPFGSGLKAVPLILEGKVPPFPLARRKPQFAPLIDELYQLVLKCVVVDPEARLTADELSAACSALCYSSAPRQEGVVRSLPFGPYAFGFINDAKGREIFFHTVSVYGDTVVVGDRVCFAAFPGAPQPRAHPVVKLQ